MTPAPRAKMDAGTCHGLAFFPRTKTKQTLRSFGHTGMLGQSGKQLKQFSWIHAMACPSENVIYAAELLNWRVQKLILKP